MRLDQLPEPARSDSRTWVSLLQANGNLLDLKPCHMCLLQFTACFTDCITCQTCQKACITPRTNLQRQQHGSRRLAPHTGSYTQAGYHCPAVMPAHCHRVTAQTLQLQQAQTACHLLDASDPNVRHVPHTTSTKGTSNMVKTAIKNQHIRWGRTHPCGDHRNTPNRQTATKLEPQGHSRLPTTAHTCRGEA